MDSNSGVIGHCQTGHGLMVVVPLNSTEHPADALLALHNWHGTKEKAQTGDA